MNPLISEDIVPVAPMPMTPERRFARLLSIFWLCRRRRRPKNFTPQKRYEWLYNDDASGTCLTVVAGPTTSEARGAVKKKLGLKRLPVGVSLSGPLPLD